MGEEAGAPVRADAGARQSGAENEPVAGSPFVRTTPSEDARGAEEQLGAIARAVVDCEACPRLRDYCLDVANKRRRAFRDWTYWGRPVPGMGDPQAELLIIGLAPAAHGGNRTGRMFTGDSSADWLVRALHRAGFANQPTSDHKDDGLKLLGAYVTAPARCAPPQNKPTAEELDRCSRFLEEEIAALSRLKAVVVLGRIAFDRYAKLVRRDAPGTFARVRPAFAHGASYDFGPHLPKLICSYHPSRQNTQTGRLTEGMFDRVFQIARNALQPNG